MSSLIVAQNSLQRSDPEQPMSSGLSLRWNGSASQLRTLANENDADAQYQLGLCYESGEGTLKSTEMAFNWFQKAAEAGLSDAQNKCGDYCRCGSGGIQQSFVESIRWYRMSAVQGNCDARLSLSMYYFEDQWLRDNEVETFHSALLRTKTEKAKNWQNNPFCSPIHNRGEAQQFIGRCYRDGLGVERSLEKAEKWFTLSAEQDCASGANSLGLFLLNCHIHTVESYFPSALSRSETMKLGIRRLREAAEHNYAPALFNLSYCYRTGRGVDQNIEISRKYTEKLAQLKVPLWMKQTMAFSLLNGTETFKDEEFAVAWLKRVAKRKNDALCQNVLGYCYLNGTGVAKDEKAAFSFFSLAAEQDQPLAVINEAHCYRHGLGVKAIDSSSITEADALAEKLLLYSFSAHDMCEIGYALSRGLFVQQNSEDAELWFERAAIQGHARSMFELALLLRRKDEGIIHCEDESMQWMLKAAEQNYRKAKTVVGKWYLEATSSTDLNDKHSLEAVRWLESAANDGDADACFELGCCYLNGSIVASSIEFNNRESTNNTPNKKSVTFAEHFLKDAASHAVEEFWRATRLNHSAALQKLLELNALSEGSYQYFELNLSLALQGDATAQCVVGSYFYSGECVRRNYEEAFEWLSLAAESGELEAQCLLGQCFLYGRGVKKNATMAVEWLSLAAEESHSRSQLLLGRCYLLGNGTNKRPDSGFELIKKAALQDDVEAMRSLGDCHWNGTGVNSSNELALEWYTNSTIWMSTTRQYTRDPEWAAVCAKIAYCHRKGLSGNKNRTEAAKWYKLACSFGDLDAHRFTSCDGLAYSLKSFFHSLI